MTAPVNPDGDLAEGVRVELTVGAVAHGGHCVARVGPPPGRVVFVRHALPGERVVAEVTEVHRGYLRADAVEVLGAAADRVAPPCPYARPGQCGGCDLQHVAPAAQLDWKAAVVREQLTRLAGLTPAEIEALRVRVEPLPGGPLGWRSRVRYAVDAAGRAGLLKHRSHEVVPVDRCRIAHPAIQALPVTGSAWPDADAVDAVASSAGDVVVWPDGGRASHGAAARGSADGPIGGVPVVRERAAGREWELPVTAFWQVHPAAPETLAGAVLELLEPRPGETAWDLYGGAGLFAAALAGPLSGSLDGLAGRAGSLDGQDGQVGSLDALDGRAGPAGRRGAVTVVEAAGAAVAAGRRGLRDLPQVRFVAARVKVALRRRLVRPPVDLVVLDPPRSGAGAEVVRAVAASGARAVAYVACDPAAFARDVRTFAGLGWRLVALRAYDCFPMTHHVECVGLFRRDRGELAPR